VTDEHLAKSPVAYDDTMHREGVEHFVGDHDRRAAGPNAIERLGPADRDAVVRGSEKRIVLPRPGDGMGFNDNVVDRQAGNETVEGM
jgi:hypothetical protein